MTENLTKERLEDAIKCLLEIKDKGLFKGYTHLSETITEALQTLLSAKLAECDPIDATSTITNVPQTTPVQAKIGRPAGVTVEKAKEMMHVLFTQVEHPDYDAAFMNKYRNEVKNMISVLCVAPTPPEIKA